MKRFGLLIVMVITGFLLVGCDAIPTDLVENTTEEICREDPDNEVCNIDSLSDVQETVAEDLVLEAITVLNDDVTDTCNTVFSVANTELLDACKNDELLTGDIDSFTILDYEKDGTTHIFKGEVDEETFVQISIEIGTVDGEMRITSFTTTSIEDPRQEALSLEEFEVFIMDYFNDYLDNTLGTDELAQMYFGVEVGTRFKMQRDDDLSSLDSLTYVSATMLEDNLFEVTYEERFGEESVRRVRDIRTEQVNNKPRLFDVLDEDCDDDGVVACPADELLNKEEVTTFIEMYYTDYLDSSVSDQAFADKYMGGEFEDNWSESRSQAIRNDITITVKEIYLNDDNEFAAEIEYQDGDDLTLRKRPGRRKYSNITLDTGYVLEEAIEASLVLDQEVAYGLIEDFIQDFQNLEITNEQLLLTYSGGDVDGDGLEDLVDTREEELKNGLTIEVDTSVAYRTFGLFPVKLTLTNGEAIDSKELSFVIKELDKATPYIHKVGDFDTLDCDSDGDGLPSCTVDESLDQEDAIEFINEYYEDYLDPDMTNEMFYNKYTGTHFEDDWNETRQRHITNDITISVKDVHFNDNFEFAAVIEYQDGDDLTVRKRPGRRKHGNITQDNGYVLYEAIEASFVLDQDVANELIEAFIQDFQNLDITNEELIRTYFGGDLDGDGLDDLLDTRTEDINDGLVIDIFTDTPYQTFGIFTVHMTLSQGEEQVTKELSFVIKELDKATPYIYKIGEHNDLDCDDADRTRHPSCYVDNDLNEEEVREFILQYYTDYLDDATSDQMFADKYMGGDFEDSWSELRRQHITNDITITLRDLYFNDNDEFAAVIEYQDGDDLTLRKRPGRAKYGDITLKKGYSWESDIVSSTVIDETYAKDVITQFFMDYQNVNISDEELLRMYFNENEFHELIMNRQEDLRNGLTIDVNTDTPYLTFGVFHVYFTLKQGDTSQTRELYFMVKEIDKATPYLYPVTPSVDNDCDIIDDTCTVVTDSTMVSQIMQKFIARYNDPLVTQEMLKDDVVGEIILGEDRDMYFESGTTISFGDTIRPLEDNFYLVQLQINHSDSIIHRDIAVRVYRSGTTFYIREDVPFDASFFRL